MASQIIADNSRIYKAYPQDTLYKEVTTTICVLLPRAFATAGLNRQGQVLAIHYKTNRPEKGEWERLFFEHQFQTDPLVTLPKGVAAIFAGARQQLLVPDELYDEEAATRWLKTIYPVPPNERIVTYATAADAHYLISLPEHIRALAQQQFKNVPLLPLAACQLSHFDKEPGPALQCIITDEEVFATLHLSGKVTWHQVFAYTHATDIAWQLVSLCKQLHIPLADLRVTAGLLNDELFEDMLELETYFPKLSWTAQRGPEDAAWEPAVYLMEQLYQCV